MITGLNTESGFALLQRYVDIRQDIQTAALLVARFPSLSCADDDVAEDVNFSDTLGAKANNTACGLNI